MRLAFTLFAAGLSTLFATPGWTTTYYVASRGTAAVSAPDGSKARPWATPAAALAKAKSGDTILLMDGDYDALEIKNRKFSTPVTIQALNPKKARLERISLTGTSGNMVFRNLSVWPSDPDKAGAARVDAGFATNVTFDGLDVRSASNATGYAGWTKEQWAARNLKGFQARGANVTLSNSSFTGMGFAVVLMGEGAKAAGNQIRGFSMDAMRVLGDNSVVSGNLITDAVRINGNHPDGIQSWSQNGKPVKGLVLKDNTIIEWSSAKTSPLRAQLQGVGFFDGYYDDLTISGNTVATTAYHGISVYGGRGVEITGNTVINGKGSKVGYPWIGIFDKKKGPPSTGVIVSGNKAMKYLGISDKANVKTSGNGVVSDPSGVLKGILANLGKTVLPIPVSVSATPSHLLDPTSTAGSLAVAPKVMALSASVFSAASNPVTTDTAKALPGDPVSVPLPAAIWPMAGAVVALLMMRRRRENRV